MSFILTAQRKPDCSDWFQRYREYIGSNKERFPRSAYELASSEWYFIPQDHRCPHDAWLESITISEPAVGERSEQRITSIRIQLLGAYHDGIIEFFYPHVFSYSLNSPACVRGLGDWRYDEFRLARGDRLIHEIEWASFPGTEGSRWIIETSDVEYRWTPK